MRRDSAAPEKVGLRKLASKADGPYVVQELHKTAAVLKVGENLDVMSL